MALALSPAARVRTCYGEELPAVEGVRVSVRRRPAVEMIVGKSGGRASKNPMRRTTSMTEFSPPDVLASVAEDVEEEAAEAGQLAVGGDTDWLAALGGVSAAAQEDWLAAYRARAAPARAGLRRNSADCSATEAAAFLRACGLCRRRLGPGRDTFMYKGEAAFCSLDCREQHITQEERSDECTVTSRNDLPTAPATGHRSGSRKSGTGGSTVAAA